LCAAPVFNMHCPEANAAQELVLKTHYSSLLISLFILPLPAVLLEPAVPGSWK
jgi:hypothetical protein